MNGALQGTRYEVRSTRKNAGSVLDPTLSHDGVTRRGLWHMQYRDAIEI